MSFSSARSSKKSTYEVRKVKVIVGDLVYHVHSEKGEYGRFFSDGGRPKHKLIDLLHCLLEMEYGHVRRLSTYLSQA